MKKLLLFCVISVVSLLFITFNVKTNKYTKIVFEMPVNRASQDLSGGEIGTITIDNPTKVVLQKKIDLHNIIRQLIQIHLIV